MLIMIQYGIIMSRSSPETDKRNVTFPTHRWELEAPTLECNGFKGWWISGQHRYGYNAKLKHKSLVNKLINALSCTEVSKSFDADEPEAFYRVFHIFILQVRPKIPGYFFMQLELLISFCIEAMEIVEALIIVGLLYMLYTYCEP